MTVYDLIAEPTPTEFEGILTAGLRISSFLSVVLRPGLGLGNTGIALLERIELNLVDTREVTEWPGTKLFGGTATLNTYLLSESLLLELITVQPNLFMWTQPELPEDICLYRKDHTPWFCTIAHEKEGWFILQEDEARMLTRLLPSLFRKEPE